MILYYDSYFSTSNLISSPAIKVKDKIHFFVRVSIDFWVDLKLKSNTHNSLKCLKATFCTILILFDLWLYKYQNLCFSTH